MKLSAVISKYREEMNISQREFSRRCGLSNSYISFIENEVNPKTGKPIVPTLEQYQKIASGMNMTVHQLFELLDDDAPVDLRTPVIHEDEHSVSGEQINPKIRAVSSEMEDLSEDELEEVTDLVLVAIKNIKKRRKG